jgi:predicted Zn-dependent protease
MNRSRYLRLNRLNSARPVLIPLLFLTAFVLLHPQVRSQTTELSPPVLSFSSATGTSSGCDRLQPIATSETATKNWLKTQQAEWALGSRLAANAEQNVEMISDSFVVQYVNQLEQKIVSRAELPGCFVVKILIDPEPNAYSLPGGFIYVTSGLVQIAESEGELAGALAHETAHVTLRHMSKLQTQSRIWRRFALFSNPAGFLLRRYLGPLVLFSMIRKEEFEADQLGTQYLAAAGYDILEFSNLLQSAIPEDETRASLLDRLYDSHPQTKSRVKRLQYLSRHSMLPQVDYLVNTSDFEQMKSRFANLELP